jgi:hypothetical protein
MTVSELIKTLKTLPRDMPVVSMDHYWMEQDSIIEVEVVKDEEGKQVALLTT